MIVSSVLTVLTAKLSIDGPHLLHRTVGVHTCYLLISDGHSRWSYCRTAIWSRWGKEADGSEQRDVDHFLRAMAKDREGRRGVKASG